MDAHFATLFEALADAVREDEALVHGTQRVRWSDYDDGAARFATFLRSYGVAAGDRVALYLFNGPEYLTAQYGVFKERCVPVNVNYRYLDDELLYLLDNSDSRVLVYHASLGERLARVRERALAVGVRAFVEVEDRPQSGQGEVTVPGASRWAEVLRGHEPAPRIARSGDDRYLLYTGGTTGMPKGVVFRTADFLQRLFGGWVYRGWEPPKGPDDVVPSALAHRAAGDRRVSIPACPLMHGTGMWLGAFYAHLMGGSVVTLEGRSFDADELWRTAEREQADAVTIVGDAFARPMLAALDAAVSDGRPYDLSAMRVIQSSGVMWSAEVQEGLLRHLDVRLADSMGSTEVGMARRIVWRGMPVTTAAFQPLTTTKVFTEDGREVTPGSGEVGRVAAGGFVPLEYHKDPEKSAATFPVIDGVRYAIAGDMAIVDADGRVVLLGRGSNCINTAGEKVFPEEVEEAVKRHPEVADCLVVGVPDERFGERVVAVASLHPGARLDAPALLDDLRTRLAHYKLPRAVHLVPTVHRAPNGKADYVWARAVATTGPAGG